ncbi:MAG: hypothetical protein ABJM06_09435 [Gilvibacter sp.]
MTLADLIGKKIKKIRFNYERENAHDMQEFQSQVMLANKEVFLIPNYPDASFDLTEYYDKNKSSSFDTAQRCGLASRLLFRNKTIVDVHFKYADGEPLQDQSGILELENGRYVTENNFGPPGLTDIDLIVMNQDQFEGLQDDDTELRSLKNDILDK